MLDIINDFTCVVRLDIWKIDPGASTTSLNCYLSNLFVFDVRVPCEFEKLVNSGAFTTVWIIRFFSSFVARDRFVKSSFLAFNRQSVCVCVYVCVCVCVCVRVCVHVWRKLSFCAGCVVLNICVTILTVC